MAPGMPFSYEFLDDSFDNMYREEQRVGQVALTFSLLAILIACLGLFGLATYMAEQRTKGGFHFAHLFFVRFQIRSLISLD